MCTASHHCLSGMCNVTIVALVALVVAAANHWSEESVMAPTMQDAYSRASFSTVSVLCFACFACIAMRYRQISATSFVIDDSAFKVAAHGALHALCAAIMPEVFLKLCGLSY